ncbi:MAG: hypothetical protein KY476_12790 [Planctomycetes bacterium]|nr:hypothetical protein [Planctomycetota bacterium]
MKSLPRLRYRGLAVAIAAIAYGVVSAARSAEPALPGGALRQIGVEADGEALPDDARPASIRGIAISLEAAIIATRDEPGDPNRERAIRLWELGTGKPLAVLTGHERPIADFDLSPDGRTLVSTDFQDSGDAEGLTRVWNVATGAPLHTIPEGGSVVRFSEDGATFALVVRDQLRIYGTADAREVLRFEGLNVTLDVSPERRLILGHSHKSRTDTLLRLHDLSDKRLELGLAGCRSAPRRAAISPDGRTVAAADGGDIVLWEIQTGEPLRRLKSDIRQLFAVSFSPNGRIVVAGGTEGTVLAWDVATGKEVHRATTHDGLMTAVAFSRDGRRFATGGTAGSALVWDAEPLLLSAPAVEGPLDDRAVESLWHDLSTPEPARAYAAVAKLADSGEAVLHQVRDKLAALLLPQQDRRIEQLIRDLDADDSTVRHRATRELRKLVQMARPVLLKVLAETDSIEVKLRIARILGGSTSPERFTRDDERRMLRIIHAAGWRGGDAAELLELIAAEFPHERIARDAKDTLARLRSR